MGRFVTSATVASLFFAGALFAQQANQAQAQKTAQSGQPQYNYGGVAQTPWFSQPGIREQLNINEDQFNRLNKVYGENWNKYNTDLGRLGDLNATERSQRMQQMGQTFGQQINTAAKDILNPQQQQRFNQLSWQYQGYNAFNDPQVQQKLNLTDEQKEKLRQHASEFSNQVNDLNKNFATDREGTSKRFNELRQRDREWMNSFLTPQQQQTWREMVGDAYDFSNTKSTPRQSNP